MLAISERSLVLLVNPNPARLARLPDEFRTRVELSRALLHHFVQASRVPVRLLGDSGAAIEGLRTLPNCELLPGDPMSFWRDERLSRQLGPIDTQVIYLGGAWLDQDVLAAALSLVHIGYDTRALVDVSVARTRFDRTWALERLEQQDVTVTTMRQTMTEWSLAAPDDRISRQLRDTLPE